MKSPKFAVYWVQLVTRTGSFNGPLAAKPTNAATAVPTASIGLEPDETSSMYTPGERYVGIAPPASDRPDPASMVAGTSTTYRPQGDTPGGTTCPNGRTHGRGPAAVAARTLTG